MTPAACRPSTPSTYAITFSHIYRIMIGAYQFGSIETGAVTSETAPAGELCREVTARMEVLDKLTSNMR